MEIRRYRERAGLTQTELAERVGVTQTYICELERRRKSSPSLTLLYRLSAVLGVSVAELLGEAVPEPREKKG